MKVSGEFELESISIKKTIGDEIGIYFCGEEKERLAFPYDSAKKAISSIKKVSKVLNVPYNISAEIELIALNENEQVIDNSNRKGKRTMANKKRNVNVKQLCKELVAQNKTVDEITTEIISVYISEGKDEKYAKNRARAYIAWVVKEFGLEPQKKSTNAKVVTTTEKRTTKEKTAETSQVTNPVLEIVESQPEEAEVETETEEEVEVTE